ncbi:MAG: restriction endonuclease [Armatimonadota bacterium]
MESENYAEANRRRLWGFLLRRIEEDRKRGLQPTFRVISREARRMAWHASDISHTSSRTERRKMHLLRSRPILLNTVDYLSDREYEALACAICRLVGATSIQLTRQSNEGGVDFFALLPVHTSSHIFSSVGTSVRLIGQCKKYGDPVKVGDIKEFLTTVSDVKGKHNAVREHIPTWFHTIRGPIVGWLVSHNGFQNGVEDRAKDEGIILSDSFDLIEMAALSRKLDVSAQPISRATFLRNMVSNILEEFK